MKTQTELGMAYRRAGRLPEAVTNLEQVRQSALKSFGPDHQYTVAAAWGLGISYRDAGRHVEARAMLGEGVRIVSALQNVSHEKLIDPQSPVDCDILITGDDAEAKEEVMHLVEAAGMRGIEAGSLDNAVAAEALTPVLLYINRKYKVVGAGIRITGI